ncbi:hypothetical protein [Exiguobacterium undae]|uniref:hypothetical protein n=1 Tax=Exiguobacterium undae TaxID=169177 RepID=UPI00384E2493
MPTNIIRFDEDGFKVKPYASTRELYGDKAYYHTGTFIDYVIDKSWLEKKNKTLYGPEELLFKPKANDTKWNGCFVFIEAFNSKEILEKLSFKSNDPMFCGEIEDDKMIVWSKNWNFKREVLIRNFCYKVVYSQNEFYKNKHFYGDTAWVKMSLETFKKRMYLAADYFSCELNDLPEELLECYFMEYQVMKLQNVKIDHYNHVDKKYEKKTKIVNYFKKLLILNSIIQKGYSRIKNRN